MNQNDVLHALYDDTIDRQEIADAAEGSLNQQPHDLITRAQLIHYYYNIEIKFAQRNICAGRLRHIEWFIRNQPDLEFCGTAPFYVRATDPQFGVLKALWQEALVRSEELKRQVNACMFLLNADRSDALRLLDKFPSNSNNIWILALRDLTSDSGTCFSSAVTLERNKPKVVDVDGRAQLLAEIKENRDWNSVALRDEEARRSSDVSKILKTDFGPNMCLKKAARIAACTAFRFESSSILRFDPEVTSIRFSLACWIVRYLPFSKLAISPIFTAPFESPKSYDLFKLGNCKAFDCLYDFSAELWAAQVSEFPDDQRVAKNAANFAIQCEKVFPSAAKLLISELRKTEIGTAALKKYKPKAR